MAIDFSAFDEKVDLQELQNEVQNFSIDAKSVDCKIELVDGKYNITINADQQQTLVDDSANGSSMDWLQIIQAVLLVAILICLVRKPKDRQ